MQIINPSTFVPFSTLAIDVIAHVSECPVFLAEDQAKLAAREFFRKTRAWRSPLNITLLTTVASQDTYAYVPPTNAELNLVQSAWNADTELDIELPGEAENEQPDTTSDTWKIGVRAGNVLVLAPAPNVAGVVIKGSVSYLPTLAGAGIPTYAYDNWGKEIAAWAAAQLVIQPKRDWTNPGAYGGLMALFDARVARVADAVGPARRRPLRVTPC